MERLYCNEGCREAFHLTELSTGVEELGNGVEHHYIECPNCRERYTSYYSNEKIRALQKEVGALRKKAPLKIKQRNRLNKLIRKLQFMGEELKKEIQG